MQAANVQIVVMLLLLPLLLLCGGAVSQITTVYMVDDQIWKYWDLAPLNTTLWRGGTFDDAAWKVGQQPLGYGLAKIKPNTTIGFGSSRKKFITSYYRAAFSTTLPTGRECVLSLSTPARSCVTCCRDSCRFHREQYWPPPAWCRSTFSSTTERSCTSTTGSVLSSGPAVMRAVLTVLQC